MARFVAPIRDKALAIQQDSAYLDKIMRHGAAKARESASRTIKIVREAMGINY